MSRQEIFNALNEDYPIKSDFSNNPIGLFETQQTTQPAVDAVPPITPPAVDVVPPTTPPTEGE